MKQQPTKLNKFAIGKEFSDGFVAAMTPAPMEKDASEHWNAGYLVGYEMREQKNEAMNAYLISIGADPMFQVHLAARK